MPRGSSSIIAQSLKTLQQNGPKLVYTHTQIQTTINACLLLISYHCEKNNKKTAVTKTTTLPKDNHSY